MISVNPFSVLWLQFFEKESFCLIVEVSSFRIGKYRKRVCEIKEFTVESNVNGSFDGKIERCFP